MPAAPLRVFALAALTLSAAGPLAGCAGLGDDVISPRPHPTPAFAEVPYQAWSDTEAGYRIYQGDVLDIAVPSAPELNRTVTVQPDGRITLPMIPPTMAADRHVTDLSTTLAQAYAPTLLRPAVEVSVKTAAPLKVFVGGEVDKPGVYDMPGDVNSLQAILMAGGFKTSAHRQEVVILRRGPGGRAMMRTVDLRTSIFDPANGSGSVPLRRFDIVFVPRSRVSEVGLFIQQYIRDLLPIQFSYAINGFSGA